MKLHLIIKLISISAFFSVAVCLANVSAATTHHVETTRSTDSEKAKPASDPADAAKSRNPDDPTKSKANETKKNETKSTSNLHEKTKETKSTVQSNTSKKDDQ